MLFPPFSFEERRQWPVTSGIDARAGRLAQTSGNLGDAGRGAARASAVTSRNLTSETERSTWRSIW
jgi:hypothetical protein